MKDIPDGCGTVVRGGAASVRLEATERMACGGTSKWREYGGDEAGVR